MNKRKHFSLSDSVPRKGKAIIEMLDGIEKRVESLRSIAATMENERDDLLNVLTMIQSNADWDLVSEGEKEDIRLITDRLLIRATTVNVSVTVPRNEIQRKALDTVNKYLDDLLMRVFPTKEAGIQLLQSYINACSSDYMGPVDSKFQEIIIDCTADDQKRIRKRLEATMRNAKTTQ